MPTRSERGAEITLSNTVNAETDLGISPGDDLSTNLNPQNHSDTLVQLEPGTYYISQTMDVRGMDGFGIESVTQNKDDVTLEANSTNVDISYPDRDGSGIFHLNPATDSDLQSNIYIGHFNVETLDDFDTNMQLFGGGFDGDFIVRDIEYLGWAGENGQKIAVSSMTTDNVGVFKDIVDKRPIQYGDYDSDNTTISFFAGEASTSGELWYDGIEIVETNESAIYTGEDTSEVHIVDSYFENCAHTSIRLTGSTSEARNCSILIDTDNTQPETVFNRNQEPINRGIWLQSGQVSREGPTIEDCDIVVESVPNMIALIFNKSEVGGTTIKNTRIENNSTESGSLNSILAQSENTDTPGEIPLTIEDVTIKGVATGGNGQVEIRDRDGTTITNSCIEFSSNTDGIVSEGSTTHDITDTNVNVGGTALVTEDGATQNTTNVTTDGSCSEDPDLSSWNVSSSTGSSIRSMLTVNNVIKTINNVRNSIEQDLVTIVEDWEDGDLSTNNWTGSTISDYSVTTNNPFNGTYALEGDSSESIISTDLPNYPQRGDYFKTLHSATGDGDRIRFFWGPDTQGYGSGSSYMIWIDTDDFVRLYDSGNGTQLGSDISINGSEITDGEYFEVHVDYGYTNNDDIEVHFYGSDGTLVGSIGPITDTAHTGTTTDFELYHYNQQNASFPITTDYIHINNNDQSSVQ